MTAADRPWWSSPDEELEVDDDLDPVEAHRRARRGAAGTSDGRPVGDGGRPGDGRPDDGSWWVPATEAVTRLARELGATAAAGAPGPGAGAARADGDADDVGGHTGEHRDGHVPGDGDGTAGGGGGGAVHRVDACGICPICVGLRAIGDARPDLVAHLAEAARHLALAVRTVVDAAAEPGEAADPSAPPRTGRRRPRHDDLQHIDLDDG